MPIHLLHILQNELSQTQTRQFLEVLGETDIVVLLQPQPGLLKRIKSVALGSVYSLYAAELAAFAEQAADCKAINHEEFVALLATCTQSRTW